MRKPSFGPVCGNSLTCHPATQNAPSISIHSWIDMGKGDRKSQGISAAKAAEALSRTAGGAGFGG